MRLYVGRGGENGVIVSSTRFPRPLLSCYLGGRPQRGEHKPEALDFEILAPATAIVDYASGAQMTVRLQQTTQIILRRSPTLKSPALLTPAQIKPKSFESRGNSFRFTRSGRASCFPACVDAMLLPQSF